MRAIDVRTEKHFEIAFAVRLESFTNHYRSKIGAPDTNIHDSVDSFAGMALPRSISDIFSKGLDFRKHLVDLRHNIAPIDVNGSVGLVPKRHMKHCAAFSVVNFLSRKHRLRLPDDIGFLGEVVQEIHRLLGDAILGVVHKEVLEFQAHLVKAGRIHSEEVTDMGFGRGRIVGCEGLPSCSCFNSGHGGVSLSEVVGFITVEVRSLRAQGFQACDLLVIFCRNKYRQPEKKILTDAHGED